MKKGKTIHNSGTNGAIALILGLRAVQMALGLQLKVSNFKYNINSINFSFKFFLILIIFSLLLINSSPKGRLAVGSKLGSFCGNSTENYFLTLNNVNNLNKLTNINYFNRIIIYLNYELKFNFIYKLLHTIICKCSRVTCMYWFYTKCISFTLNVLHISICKCSRFLCMYWFYTKCISFMLNVLHILICKCSRFLCMYWFYTKCISIMLNVLHIFICKCRKLSCMYWPNAKCIYKFHCDWCNSLCTNFNDFLFLQTLHSTKLTYFSILRNLNPTKSDLIFILVTCSKVNFFQNIFMIYVETCMKACSPKWSLAIRGKLKKGALFLRSLTFAASKFYHESRQIAFFFSKKQANSENISSQISHKNRVSFPQSGDYSVKLNKLCQIMIMIMIRSDSLMKVLANSKFFSYKFNFNFKLILFNSSIAGSKNFLKHLFFLF